MNLAFHPGARREPYSERPALECAPWPRPWGLVLAVFLSALLWWGIAALAEPIWARLAAIMEALA